MERRDYSQNGHAHPDPVEAAARLKRVPVEALRAYGATAAERISKKSGKPYSVARVPAYNGTGALQTYFDLPTFGEGKGWWKEGGGSGLFLPDGQPPQPGEEWLVVEGVKDAAALFSLGHKSIGLPGSEMAVEYARLLRSVHVTIVPDRDRPGEQGAQKTASRLYGVAASVKIATLPAEFKETKGADVRDVLQQKDGEQQLRQCLADAIEWGPANGHHKANGEANGKLIGGAGRVRPPGGKALSLGDDAGRTEAANAKRFCARFGDQARWCDPWGKWLVWDGKRWAIDRQRDVDDRAKQVASGLWPEFAEVAQQAPKSASTIAGFCKASNSAKGIASMLALARSEPGIAVLPESLDQDHWVLNVANGTLKLRTGELQPHRREDYLTKLAPVEYLPAAEAECPTWERFLEEVFEGKDDLIRFVQRAAGYSLTGSTCERCFFFLYGTGRNGKTTLLATLQKVWSDYATTLTTEMLMVRDRSQHPTEICDLHGRRLAVASETEDGRRFAEALIKQITGGEDRMKGRRMKEDFWEFRATHKLWLAGNHKPAIRGTDPAIWDRVKLVPFLRRFDKPDKDLAAKLAAELPGILRWCVQGCLEWQHQGLGEPGEVKAATAAYRDEMDLLGAFINDHCIVGSDYRVRATDLYAAYARWCEATREYQQTQRRFGQSLTERGYERYTSNGTWYRGIRLVQD
jgi:putative DNA primase/helicase